MPSQHANTAASHIICLLTRSNPTADLDYSATTKENLAVRCLLWIV